MKILLTLFVLLFSSSLFADDISDFQIEGMSIGDTLLDYFSEEEIIDQMDFIYKDTNKKGSEDIASINYEKNLNLYDVVQVNFKHKDNTYEIVGMMGTIFFEENLEGCYKKQKQIFNELKLIFQDKEFDYSEVDHPGYPKDQVKIKRYSFFLVKDERSNLEVMCYDVKLKGYEDRLIISLKSIEFNKWMERIFE